MKPIKLDHWEEVVTVSFLKKGHLMSASTQDFPHPCKLCLWDHKVSVSGGNTAGCPAYTSLEYWVSFGCVLGVYIP